MAAHAAVVRAECAGDVATGVDVGTGVGTGAGAGAALWLSSGGGGGGSTTLADGDGEEVNGSWRLVLPKPLRSLNADAEGRLLLRMEVATVRATEGAAMVALAVGVMADVAAVDCEAALTTLGRSWRSAASDFACAVGAAAAAAPRP